MKRLLVVLALAAQPGSAQSIISTVAGTDWVFNADGRPALEAPIGEPRGVFPAADGSIYFIDRDNRMVMKLDRHGTLSVVAGNGNSGSANVTSNSARNSALPASLIDIIGDRSGNLYISSAVTILKIEPSGRISPFAGGGSTRPGDGLPATRAAINPFNMAFDRDGNLYFTDYSSHRVRKVDAAGILTTVAGNGSEADSGDGGPATQAALTFPQALAFDSAGNLYVGTRSRIRKITADGIISTAVSSVGSFILLVDSADALIYPASGDFMRLETSGRTAPIGLRTAGHVLQAAAIEPDGSILLSDAAENNVIRFAPNRQLTTIAGNGGYRLVPDGTPAVSAYFDNPVGLAVGSRGEVFTVDWNRGLVSKFTPGGDISRQAQLGRFSRPTHVISDSTGNVYVSSVSGIFLLEPGRPQRVIAFVNSSRTPELKTAAVGLALDAANNLYLSDEVAHRIFKLPPTGNAVAFAGTGVAGFSGDNGPALQAQLNRPAGLAFDTSGNLYVAEQGNQRIRRITPQGVISTIAGDGGQGSSGDGGLPIAARFNSPFALAVDPEGRILVADRFNSRIRRITIGQLIETVAGSGISGFAGDGGLATAARISSPTGVAVDARGVVYVADSLNNRIRAIRPNASFDLSVNSLRFSDTASAPAEVRLSTASSGLAFTAVSDAPWLSVNPPSGTLPSVLQVNANPAGLSPGLYTARITVTAPLATPPVREITVSLTVPAVLPPKLGVGAPAVSFAVQQGSGPASASVSVSNQGGGMLDYSVSVRTDSGGAWLSAAPTAGRLAAGASETVVLQAQPGAIAEGTYAGSVSIVSAAATVTIPVSLSITLPKAKLLLSQTGLTFTAVEGGGNPSPQSFGVLNEGAGELSFDAKATLLSGADWLRLGNASGRIPRPLQDVRFVDVVPDTTRLSQGEYYAEVRVTSPGLAPLLVTVLVKVLPRGANPGPEVRPSGLVFIGGTGDVPPSEEVRVTNLTGAPTTFVASNQTFDGGKWVSHVPAAATVIPSVPGRIVVQPDFTGIAPGVKRGAIFLLFDDGSTRTINILSIVPATAPSLSGKQRPRDAANCGRPNLRAEFLSIPENTTVSVGQPVSLEVKVADECGNLLLGNERNANSAVFAKFSNGDADLRLIPLGNGIWTGTWRPLTSASSSVVVSAVSVFVQGLLVQGGRTDRTLRVNANANAPIIRQGSLVHGATQRNDAPVASGSLVTIYGANLASAPKLSSVPLPTEVDGTQVLLGGQPLPILFSSATQLNVQVPFDLPINTEHQVVVRRAETLSVPEPFLIAGAQPGVFTSNLQGTGQGIIMGPDQVSVATPANPALRGQPIIIYCTGLGAVNPPVQAGSPAPTSRLSPTTLPVNVQIGGTPAQVLFSGLTPGFAGLYQINAIVPATTTPGDAVPLTVSVAGQTGNTVTFAVR